MTTRQDEANHQAPHTTGGLRASDTERERTVETLRNHYETGHLGYAEFNERMERAYQATHSGDLTALVADLPGGYRQPSAPAVAAPPSRKEPSGTGRTIAIIGLVVAALVGLGWLTALVTSHPVITLLAAGAVVWLVVKRPFRRNH